MKATYLALVLAAGVFLFSGCDELNDSMFHDHTAPAPPTGIRVYNGDNEAELTWNRNREDDVAGYNVYYSSSYNGRYELIGHSVDEDYLDRDAANGAIYYYAVTAYDFNGNESELSRDVAYSVPRPEGYNQSIFDFRRFASNSGYDFSNYRVTAYDDNSADVYFENYNGTFYLNVWSDSDIQDMGPTYDIYDITYAPLNGWSTSKDVQVRTGHTYLIWTWDNHFAKLRVRAVTQDRIVFDWAYQMIEGNQNLRPVRSETERGIAAQKVLRLQQSKTESPRY